MNPDHKVVARCLCGVVQMRLTLDAKARDYVCAPEGTLCNCSAHGGRGGIPWVASCVFPMNVGGNVTFDRGLEMVETDALEERRFLETSRFCAACEGPVMLYEVGREDRIHVWKVHTMRTSRSGPGGPPSTDLVFYQSKQGDPTMSVSGRPFVCTLEDLAEVRRPLQAP